MTKLLTDKEISGIYKKSQYYPHMLCNYERAIEAAVITKMLALIGEPVAWGIPHRTDKIFFVISPEEHGEHKGAYSIPLYKLPKELK